MIILKKDYEIEIMREGGQILKKIILYLKNQVKPGIKTDQLNQKAEKKIADFGIKPSFLGYKGYPKSLCTSVNEEVVHAIPSERVLKEGDIIGLDLGICYKGYHTDVALTVGVGKISPIHQKLIKVTYQALLAGIGQARPNNKLGQISWAIQKTIEKAGFSVVKDCAGHGVGREIHEEPTVPNFGSPDWGPVLLPGLTIAIEPMANEKGAAVMTKKDGWAIKAQDAGFSAHFEHTVAITKKGCLVLTG